MFDLIEYIKQRCFGGRSVEERYPDLSTWLAPWDENEFDAAFDAFFARISSSHHGDDTAPEASFARW